MPAHSKPSSFIDALATGAAAALCIAAVDVSLAIVSRPPTLATFSNILPPCRCLFCRGFSSVPVAVGRAARDPPSAWP